MRESPAQIIDPVHADPAATANAQAQTRPCCLLLDFDGTLAEIRSTPDEVAVDTAMVQALAGVARRLNGRMAIVSGRSLAQLDALLPPMVTSCVIAASHGQELRVDGVVQAPEQTGLFADMAFEATLHFQHTPGIVIEEKTYGLGVHYRLAPEMHGLVDEWTMAQAARHDLAIQHGDMVVELRLRGPDKGDAVRAIMALPHFSGSSPIFIGDDLTDIPAFHAVQALGGHAISVGPRTAGHADEQLDDVAAVRARIEEVAA
ncbi:trehalose-phosphatase [Blastomonas sp. AAP53]|uniref:trehalose-phosphatase n=1 Tax=Blastomonas sp. AAP53 TaxID=1248760 RepID=UPI0002DA41C8|nr:trehalose-phosphatase [Blastomonas sp. AAP53]